MDSRIQMRATLLSSPQWYSELRMTYVPELGGCVRMPQSSLLREEELMSGEKPSALTDNPFLNPDVEWDEYTCPKKLPADSK